MRTSKQIKIDFPFDQYSRLFQVATVIDSLRQGEEKFRILDVGGYGGRTSTFFPKDEVLVADVFDVEEKGYIKASGADLPFKDSEFDFVVSFDVFEHVFGSEREEFIKESYRVAQRGVICAAPFDNEFNPLAEKELNEINKLMYGENHRWLIEHIENGLPGNRQAEDLMKKVGLGVVTIGSNVAEMWMLMQGALFINSKYNLVPQNLVDLNYFYNSSYVLCDGSDNLEDNYRKIVYGMKQKGDYKLLTKLSSKQGIAAKDRVKIIGKMLRFYDALLSAYDEKNRTLEDRVSDLVEQVKEVKRQLESVTQENEAIKSSKSYTLAKKIAKAKNVIK